MYERNLKLKSYEKTEKEETSQEKQNTRSFNSENDRRDKYVNLQRQETRKDVKEEASSSGIDKYKSFSYDANFKKLEENKNRNVYCGNPRLEGKNENRKKGNSDNSTQKTHLMSTHLKKESISKISDLGNDNKIKHNLHYRQQTYFHSDHRRNTDTEQNVLGHQEIQRNKQMMELEQKQEGKQGQSQTQMQMQTQEEEDWNEMSNKRKVEERKDGVNNDNINDIETIEISENHTRTTKFNCAVSKWNYDNLYEQNTNCPDVISSSGMEKSNCERKIKSRSNEYGGNVKKQNDYFGNIKNHQQMRMSDFSNQPTYMNKENGNYFDTHDQNKDRSVFHNNERYVYGTSRENYPYENKPEKNVHEFVIHRNFDYEEGEKYQNLDESDVYCDSDIYRESDVCREQKEEKEREENEHFRNWNKANNLNQKTHYDTNTEEELESRGRDLYDCPDSGETHRAQSRKFYIVEEINTEWKENKGTQKEETYNQNYVKEVVTSNKNNNYNHSNNYNDSNNDNNIQYEMDTGEVNNYRNREDMNRNHYFNISLDQKEGDYALELKERQQIAKDIMDHINNSAENEENFQNYPTERRKSLSTFINDTCDDFYDYDTYNEQIYQHLENQSILFKNAHNRSKKFEVEREERCEAVTVQVDPKKEDRFDSVEGEQGNQHSNEKLPIMRKMSKNIELEDSKKIENECSLNPNDYEEDICEEVGAYRKEKENVKEKDKIIEELLEEAKKIENDSTREDNNKNTEMNYKNFCLSESGNLYDEIRSKCKKKISDEYFSSMNNEFIHLDTQYLDHLKNEEQALWEENNKMLTSGPLMENEKMTVAEGKTQGDNLNSADVAKNRKVVNDRKDANGRNDIKDKKDVKEIKLTNMIRPRTGTKPGSINSSSNDLSNKIVNPIKIGNKTNISRTPMNSTNTNKISINKTNTNKTNTNKTNIEKMPVSKTTRTGIGIGKRTGLGTGLGTGTGTGTGIITKIGTTTGNKASVEKLEQNQKRKISSISRTPTSSQNQNCHSAVKTMRKEFGEFTSKTSTNKESVQQQKPLNKYNSFVKSDVSSKQIGGDTTNTTIGGKNNSNIPSNQISGHISVRNSIRNLTSRNKHIMKQGSSLPVSSRNITNTTKIPIEKKKEQSENNECKPKGDISATSKINVNVNANKMKNKNSPVNVLSAYNNKNSSSISNSASVGMPKKRSWNKSTVGLVKPKETTTHSTTTNKMRKINESSQNEKGEPELEREEEEEEEEEEKEEKGKVLSAVEESTTEETRKEKMNFETPIEEPTEDRSLTERIGMSVEKSEHSTVLNTSENNKNHNNNSSMSTIMNKEATPDSVNLKNRNILNIKKTEKWKTTDVSNSTLSSNTSQSCRNRSNVISPNLLKRSNTTVRSNTANKGGTRFVSKCVPPMQNKGDVSKRSTNAENTPKINISKRVVLKGNIHKPGTTTNVSNSSSVNSARKGKIIGTKCSTTRMEKQHKLSSQIKNEINSNTNTNSNTNSNSSLNINANAVKDVVEEEMKKFTNSRKYKLKSNSIPPGGNVKNNINNKMENEEHDDLKIERKIKNVNKNCLVTTNSDIMNYTDTDNNSKFNSNANCKSKKKTNEINVGEKENDKQDTIMDSVENKEKKEMSYFEWLAHEKKRKEMKEAEVAAEEKERNGENNMDNDDDDFVENDNDNDSDNLMLEPLSAFNLRQNQKAYEQHDFIVDRHPIGNGRTGLVFKAIIKNENEKVALKVMAKDTIYTLNIERQVLKEIIIQASLKHINILELIAYFEDKTRLFLILELANGGSIRNKLKLQSEPLKEEEVALYVYQIADALSYLHNFNIIHRDLKPDNILIHYSDEHSDNKIYKYGIIKLADFGFSCQLKNKRQKRSTFCGTVDYMPPEIINQVPYDCNVDLWCLGIVIFELLVGFPPFTDNTQERIFDQIKELNFHFPKTVPRTAQELILRLCSRTAEERISAEEVKSHPWIKQFI